MYPNHITLQERCIVQKKSAEFSVLDTVYRARLHNTRSQLFTDIQCATDFTIISDIKQMELKYRQLRARYHNPN